MVEILDEIIEDNDDKIGDKKKVKRRGKSNLVLQEVNSHDDLDEDVLRDEEIEDLDGYVEESDDDGDYVPDACEVSDDRNAPVEISSTLIRQMVWLTNTVRRWMAYDNQHNDITKSYHTCGILLENVC